MEDQPMQSASDCKSTNNVLEINDSVKEIENQKVQLSPAHKASSYRPDIDGLRTIAVGIVVFFHAWPQLLTGGFIGVDIFFVISGYLITQILTKENSNGTFSYLQFYNRRVKRIYPALIFVLLFVLYVGLRFSDKQHFEMLTRTMAASTIFGANIEILTYKEGYFDANVKTNPLLHLWSLGVEEQFYIFWPFLIALLLTKFNFRSFHLLSAYTLLSFVINIVAVYISDKFCFYFPFCRFWQMAIGGLLAIKAIKINNQFYAHALSATGLITILISSFILSERNLYPGWWAVFPTMASAAIIQSGPESLVNKYILSNKLMVFLGKISYSLYLWHWPLLVFSRILYPEGSESILSKTWFIVLLSLMMSLLSYFLVENPIRFKKEKSIFVVLLVIMLIIGIGSTIMYMNAERIKNEDNMNEQKEQQNEVVFGTQNNNKLTPIQKDKIQAKTETSTNKLNQSKQNSKSASSSTNKQNFQQKQQKNQKNTNQKSLWEKYDTEMIPTDEDCYQKNGRKIPNFSKNKNRTPSTVQKIKISAKKHKWFQKIFDKKIDATSKYYRAKLPNSTMNFEVSNQGQQKLVLLVGDSHAHSTAFRFAKVFEDYKKANRTKELPTFVSIIFQGTTLIKYEESYKFVIEFIEEFKPDRILFVYCWYYYSIKHGYEDWSKVKDKRNYADQYFYENIGYFIDVVRNSTKMGIEVTTTTFQPSGDFYNPQLMVNRDGLIQKKLKPVKLDDIMKKYRHLAEHLESQVKKAGGKVISYVDHLCWEGMCEVLAPSGYSIFYDTNHWNYGSSRHWLTSVDFLVEFDKKQN